MSYILEALKKSDQERKRGTVPDLNSTALGQAPGPRGRPFWPILLAAALFINAGLFMWWARPWNREAPVPEHRASLSNVASTAQQTQQTQQTRELGTHAEGNTLPAEGSPTLKDDVTVPAPKAPPPTTSGKPVSAGLSPELSQKKPAAAVDQPAQKQQNRASPPVEAAPRKAPAPPPKETAKVSERSSATTFKRSGSEAPAPSAAQGPAGTARDSGPGTHGKAAGDPGLKELIATHLGVDIDKVEQAMKQQSREVGHATPTSPSPSGLPADTPQKSPLGSHFEERTAPKLPSINELPSSIRDQLPKMTFSGFVYSQNKSDRMVIINGRVRREGDEVHTGLILEQISPHGAVFNHKGTRFIKAQ